MAQYIPVLGDFYRIETAGWMHKHGSVAKVIGIDHHLIRLDHPDYVDGLFVPISHFNTDNLIYVGKSYRHEVSEKEISDMKNGLEKLLKIKSP